MKYMLGLGAYYTLRVVQDIQDRIVLLIKFLKLIIRKSADMDIVLLNVRATPRRVYRSSLTDSSSFVSRNRAMLRPEPNSATTTTHRLQTPIPATYEPKMQYQYHHQYPFVLDQDVTSRLLIDMVVSMC